MTNVQLDANQNGTVTFASDVLATIAALAANEVEGVVNLGGTTGFADIFKGQSKNLTRGVKIETGDNTVRADIAIVVDYGSPIPDVAYGIQENVKKAIETMSGMMVSAVDVHIQGVSFDNENKSTAQIETQRKKLLNRQAVPEGAKEEKDGDDFDLFADEEEEKPDA
jgi:uncharacterized alkaline shock family protein YloU